MKKGKGRNNGLLPNSLRIISSCLKTVSTNASNVASTVRSAGASVATSISTASEDHKDQVTWAGFDRLEVNATDFKHVLLLGYQNGFQVLDVEDASNFNELVSKRDGPVSFLQMQPLPRSSSDREGFISSHPMLLVVAGDDTKNSSLRLNPGHLGGTAQDIRLESQSGNSVHSPTTVRFYSLQSHCYVHVLRFRSSVCMVRCSSQIVAVGLATQIYCFDALTLQNKFSVLTYPVPQMTGPGSTGVNVGYGPMAVGPRWLAYASGNPYPSNASCLSPQNLTPSPGLSPSTSPSGSSLVARYAMESSKQLAAGIINLGDMGYKTLSKCYLEMLPDGSNSPISPNSAWKTSRMAGTDLDSAGLVVVKDFVSRAVISQFKAHTSPISALCFDPSGTLLVTASIYGNNINIFRIMPCCKRIGSGNQSYDWSMSHVHLYKLHRGITSAVIQDICFGHYSQWVAIVSSKGTCHIFVLSPFGGDIGFRALNTQSEELSLFPVSSRPWWSTSSYVINQQHLPPPPPVALSVVSRIKYSSFGWLNTVSNAAASATGKVFVPSGAVAAVFHNSMLQSLAHINSRTNSLEHLLVYTPSGHVVQHELLLSIGIDPADGGLQKQKTSHVHVQDDDLRVKVEPVQWWDVCGRLDWPDREENISKMAFSRSESAEKIQHKSGCEDGYCMEFLKINDDASRKRTPNNISVQTHESQSSNWYIANAEVQVNSGRSSVWQQSEISFHIMTYQKANTVSGGEFEIEKALAHEVEIRHKELLPVFDHFHSIKSGWNDRFFSVNKHPIPSVEHHQGESKVAQETIICHSKPASLSSTESSEAGSSRRLENVLDIEQMNGEKCYIPSCQMLDETWRVESRSAVGTAVGTESFSAVFSAFSHPESVEVDADNPIGNGISSSEEKAPHPLKGITQGTPSNSDGGTSDISTTCKCYASDLSILADGLTLAQAQNQVVYGLGLGEQKKCSGLSEVVNDEVDSSSSQLEKEKLEKDVENDEMLGDMFSFSEEG